MTLERVEWKQTMGYTFAYPYDLPYNRTNGGGGVSGVAMDSKGNLWAFQRNATGQAQLFEFGPDHKLISAPSAKTSSATRTKPTASPSTKKTMCGSATPTDPP